MRLEARAHTDWRTSLRCGIGAVLAVAAIAAALVACDHALSELTAEEKRMTWLGHPHWLAEDRTIAAELLALLMVRRIRSMQFI